MFRYEAIQHAKKNINLVGNRAGAWVVHQRQPEKQYNFVSYQGAMAMRRRLRVLEAARLMGASREAVHHYSRIPTSVGWMQAARHLANLAHAG